MKNVDSESVTSRVSNMSALDKNSSKPNRRKELNKQGKVTEPEKSVDFVLVYEKSAVTDDAYTKIETFIFNLEQKGFQLKSSVFTVNDDINFIKIHAPDNVLLNFAEIFNIQLSFQNVDYKVYPTRPYEFMGTELTLPDIYSPNYARARATLSGVTPATITNAEKGLIIHKVLSKNPYGDQRHEYGIEKLINKKIFDSAFPLHDGPHEWTQEGPLNDRQLLTKYWSSLKCWYKQQPLDLIEKYYGPETSFYFAWLGFYNRMLIPASAAGFAFFLLGIVSFHQAFTLRSKEVCESDLILCPRCIVEHCKYELLKSSCLHSHLIYLFDNPLVITFAALMSIWSTVFLELWRREEAMLQIRWNLRHIETDCSLRPEYEEKTPYRRISPITGTLEPYTPKKILCYRYAITSSAILLLGLLMALGIFGVMVYVKSMSVFLTRSSSSTIITTNVGLVASASGSIMSVCFILLFELLYGKIAMWLTNKENPRTQVDFDNSYTYKSYAIAFVNNYCVIFYIAFMKARFYTYPGDHKLWTSVGGIGSDLCDPAGCIIELGIQLVIILLAKNLLMTAKQYIRPQVLIWINRFRKKKDKSVDITLQWECDYMLNAVVKYHMMGEYMQMIIQYGFVTFFVAAFPPAPLLALFNNLIELRVDAFKMTQAYRRPVAFKVPNLAAWNGILQGVTYIGVATNAFVIAFTSEFVQRAVYKHTVTNDLQGYVNSTLSAFNVSEYPLTYEGPTNISVCYYPGKRYPPDHTEKYELTDDHWYNLTIKFLTVVIFEHLVMLVTGVIAYIIPDIPFSVKEHINYQRDQYKEVKLKALQNTYLRQQDKKKTDIFAEM
ncbi:anoctamin-4-like isoform X2 [Tenebrio molitor]|uniref:anoctamin-4-like isoform X2 n=1 Tax=Tenebrio molitor TaxID=7067 RepID=UPI003624815B